VYGSRMSAREIAELGVKAGCEYDTGTGLPMNVASVKLATVTAAGRSGKKDKSAKATK
jgi:ATP-dependent HslUV protease, peptidase subunit HslV